MRLNDINISIGKDKLRTAIIFLSGFAAGGVTVGICLKPKLRKRVEAKYYESIEQLYDSSTQCVDRASDAVENLITKTRRLEEALKESEATSGLSFYETLSKEKK